jgi:hypothetical protein
MSTLRKIFAPLALAAAALSLAGCGETPAQLAAKPAIVQQMVENSESVCQTGPLHSGQADYAERLTHMLNSATTSSLKTLQDHHVTVCLDQRLMNQNHGFWDLSVKGVYYPSADGKNIMTYADDGRSPSESGFWSSNPAFFRGPTSVNRLADKINAGKVPGASEGLMTVTLQGKGSYPYWNPASTSPKSALNATPQLRTPPLAAPAKPAS